MDLSPVVDAFDAAADRVPLALSLRRGPEVVLHRAAGRRADGRPFDVTTPVLLYSAAKAAVGLTAVLLAARGDLDLDAPVARTWPAFAAHGKGHVTVAQALAHGAGVPGWPDGMDLDGLRDVDGACARLADQPLWWPAGEPGEHVYSYGHVVSGILPTPVHRLWADELAGPLGLDLTLLPHPDADPVRDPDGAFMAGMRERAATQDPRLWQPLELCDADVVNGLADDPRPPIAPAVLGWGSADALARMYAFWSGSLGHLPGKPAVWARSRRPMVEGVDRVMGGEARAWAAGVGVEGSSWGMAGIGGCAAWHDDRTGLSVAVTGPVLGMGELLDPLDDAITALAP